MSEQEGTSGRAYLKYLISQIRCPVCHHRYSPDDILIMGHKNELWFMALACPGCDTRGLILATVSNQQTSAELLTDLTPEEIAQLEEREAITADDVLDFHEFLRDYRGDMTELLADEP